MNRRRTVGGAFPIRADSLIDILVCVVGFMIVLVLFTVIAGRGRMVAKDVTVTVLAPVLQQSLEAPERKLVLCQDGRASLLDVDAVITEAVDVLNAHDTYGDGVEAFNRQELRRGDYSFRLKGYATPDALIQRTGAGLLVLIVDRVKDGASLRELRRAGAPLRGALQAAVKPGDWVHFLVDEASVDVFWELRPVVREAGALVGWEPVDVEFPLQEPLNAESGSAGMDLIRGFQQTK